MSINKKLLCWIVGLATTTALLTIPSILFREKPSNSSELELNIPSSFSTSIRKKKFPSDVGWVNIKEQYGAKGDGITDDTKAIIKALNANNSDYTRPKLIYFPQGTYLVSDTLEFPSGGQKCCVTFQGQGQKQTVIKLKDSSAKFNQSSKPKAVIKTTQGNMAFRNYIRDLTIDTGNQNPAAIGLDYISNNRGAIVNVTIKSSDGLGKIGLALIRQWPGPSLIKNLTVEGFDYGIKARHGIYGLALEHINLTNQKIAGIENSSNTLAIRGLKSNNHVPVIQNKYSGLVIILESEFIGGKLTTSAIENNAYLYARDIKASGYKSAIKNKDRLVQSNRHQEYISHTVYSLFDSPQHSLNLPIEETPDFVEPELNNWANVRNYSSVQAAMNSGKSIVYFPRGNYQLEGKIQIPATVKKIIGFESFINLNQDELKAAWQIKEKSNDPLVIEGFLLNGVTIEHLSPRTLAIKHSKLQDKIKNSPQAGKLFLEDVQTKLDLKYPQHVWARQLNAETLKNPDIKVFNRGGDVWILGLKTEGKDTVIKTTKGGKTELLGTIVYPVEIFEEDEKNQAAFINNESSHSLIYSISANKPERNYRIQIREWRNNQEKLLWTKTMKDQTMPLFVGYPK